MKIGEVIKIYRKKENLTQEQIANYLNVSAPAVNKWEKGISSPDIMLLAPLARILKIDLNTLLSFNIELTQNEIKNFLEDIANTIKEKSFEEGFQKAEDLIKQYPNCDKLLIHLSEIMNVHLELYKGKDKEYYDKKIISWFELLASSSNERTASIGKYDLAAKYIKKQEYEKAQGFLDEIPNEDDLNITTYKKILQAHIFENTEKNNEAYEIYNSILFKSATEIMTALSFIIKALCSENKYDLAKKYQDISKKTAQLYELGIYSEISNDLIAALDKQDKEELIKTLETVINEITYKLKNQSESNLFSFRRFKGNPDVDGKRCKNLLKGLIENNKEFDFARDDIRVKMLIKKLEI